MNALKLTWPCSLIKHPVLFIGQDHAGAEAVTDQPQHSSNVLLMRRQLRDRFKKSDYHRIAGDLISDYKPHNIAYCFAISEVELILRHAYKRKVHFIRKFCNRLIDFLDYYPYVINDQSGLSGKRQSFHAIILSMNVISSIHESRYNDLAPIEIVIRRSMVIYEPILHCFKH